ncbi:MAG: GAF domain-containing protein [Deltaproteobacteria bacterium]|nr:GAF domain-containing protein [Deltaproteobacteria bacterium]
MVIRNYRVAGPVGRRQLRWALFGMSIAAPTQAAAGALLGTSSSLDPWAQPLLLLSVVVPLSVAIAIIRFDLFDIDRLISVTAAYAATLFVLSTTLLVAIPQFAGILAAELDVQTTWVEIGFALTLAAIAIPAQAVARPLVDRVFFKERFALQQGIAELLRELGSHRDAGELHRHVGKRLNELLRPHSCVVYGLESNAFAPAFTQAPPASPCFAANDPLIAVLEQRAVPLAIGRRFGQRPEFGAFDRAALETLRAAVVVPAKRERLVAFICLGPKRSGDIYTATDLALLAAVGDKLASELTHLDQSPTRAADVAAKTEPPRAAVSVGAVEESRIQIQKEPDLVRYVLRKEGDVWAVGDHEVLVRLKDSKGLQYLAQLIDQPGRSFHVSELLQNGFAAASAGNNGNRRIRLDDDGPTLDRQAKQAYKDRLDELREELIEAERFNDSGRTTKLQEEIEALRTELSAAFGLGERSRRSGSMERARQTITKRIKETTKKIDELHKPLGQHLKTYVKTGSLCSYAPPPSSSVIWDR